MEEMNRSLRFSSLKGCGLVGAGVRLIFRKSTNADKVAPPVMRMGVR